MAAPSSGEDTSLATKCMDFCHCESSFKTENGLKIHRGRSHKEASSPEKLRKSSTQSSLLVSPTRALTGKRWRTALRLTRSLYKWDFNPLNGISGRVCEFWPRFSVFLPRMQGFGEKIWVKRVLKKNWKSAGFWILLPILDWKSVR